MDSCQLHYICLVRVYLSILHYFLPAAYILNVNALPFGKETLHTTLRSGLLGHPYPA